jgi:hypothetical protein
MKSSTQKDLQECRQLKPKGKLLQTNGLAPDSHPYLKESLQPVQGLLSKYVHRGTRPEPDRRVLSCEYTTCGRESDCRGTVLHQQGS